MFRYAVSFVVAFVALAGCGEELPSVVPCTRVSAGFVPVLEDTECAVEAPRAGTLRCGVLHVAEDPSVDSCELRIAFARYEPVDARDEPPLFVLGGGPGGPLVPYMAEVIELGAEVAPGRVVVAHDPRGVGLSTPTLDCSELPSDITDRLEWYRRCGELVREQGHLETRYRTPVLADDVAALARALEVDTFDVFGASYGSRLAHYLAFAYPKRVRALVFDAATPLDTPLLERTAGNLERAFGRLADDCAADDGCAAAHGDLRAHLEEVLQQLAENPASLEDGTELEPDLFSNLLGAMLASAGSLPTLPAALAAAAEGDWSTFETALAQSSSGEVALWMHHAIMCSEELPHNDARRSREDLQAFPSLASVSAYDALAARCAALGLDTSGDADLSATPAPEQPTLALTGRYDPASPASNWDDVEGRLPNGALFDIGDAGHGARRTSCGAATIQAFLEAPEAPVWPSCVDEVQAATFVY